jgi:hypothetical protein
VSSTVQSRTRRDLIRRRRRCWLLVIILFFFVKRRGYINEQHNKAPTLHKGPWGFWELHNQPQNQNKPVTGEPPSAQAWTQIHLRPLVRSSARHTIDIEQPSATDLWPRGGEETSTAAGEHPTDNRGKLLLIIILADSCFSFQYLWNQKVFYLE